MANASDDMELGTIQDPAVQFLLHSIRKKRKEFSASSIHMVPSRLRDLNRKVFNPRFFSIGPLHRTDKNLLAFEEKKPIFLHDLLLSCFSPVGKTLETCVEKVNASMDRIRACYEDGMKSYSDDEIASMMVLDAGFILEFLHKSSSDNHTSDTKNMLIEPTMIYDLLLLENQIPYFVLQDIFDCTCNSSRFNPAEVSLNQFILSAIPSLKIFGLSLEEIMENIDDEEEEEAHGHILGLMHKCYKPSHPPPSNFSNSTIYSAVELNRAGVNFKPHHHQPQWPLAIEVESSSHRFTWPWAKPTLRMPVLIFDDTTELIFRNLIAYEQLSQRDHYITSYAGAMDMLIDTQEDIGILVESKVLINIIGSKEDAANMINDLCKNISCQTFFYWGPWLELHTYCNRYWPKNIAWLRRTYFNSPWNFIALLSVIFLFILTIVQTYFTINPL